ncbi:hypothetical protein AVEN_262181-1 [Araneus ventricosus]|uniref:Uncharacterized protein n=1 Tax=Araneus ventricosus TaxID=182803 RepID=A0A4Y2S6N8_ARAVE|nr:hypothetical protein AVEN_262181-1 [Araneus ventricosus]
MRWYLPLQTSAQNQREDLGPTASGSTCTRPTNTADLSVIKFRTRSATAALPLGHSGLCGPGEKIAHIMRIGVRVRPTRGCTVQPKGHDLLHGRRGVMKLVSNFHQIFICLLVE